MVIDPLVLKAIAIGLGLMMLLAACHKFSDLAGFKVTLIEYQVVPERLISLAQYLIPIIELLIGGAWLLAFYFSGATALATATLLAVYAVAIGVNIKRGRVHFDCGCSFGGSTESEQFLTAGLIVRNIIFIIAALLTLIPVSGRDFGFSDFLVLMAVLLSATLLLGAVNQLLANRSAINTWRKANE